ncbi:MAG: hypothetical protein JW791_00765 [Nanoarchaeota archaeon]|nr:hypothetical protein [Nanoarchaeota archaeon]
MKIFRKTHFWKDNRTFIEIEAKNPEKERGFAKEGSLLLKIGEQSNVKAAFKLDVDEARALRDSIDMFLRFHDMKFSELMTEQQEQFEKIPDYYPRDEFRKDEHVSEPQKTEPFFMFGSADEPKKEKDVNSEFYF